MADKMTLQQTLSFFRSVIQSGEPWTKTCESAYSASMAHIAAMGEPVGCVTISHFRNSPNMENHDFDYYGALPDGAHTLFAAPPASGDWDKVREVITDLHEWGDSNALGYFADKLTAALPDSQP